MSNKDLSLDDFKKWMRNHSAEDSAFSVPTNPLVGICVSPKISPDRLVLKMSEATASEIVLAKEFVKYGGTIADVNEKNFLIEVKSGTFFIHRGYVTRM